jgi:hypothetical protein
MVCTNEDPAPRKTNVKIYKPECGQEERPGKFIENGITTRTAYYQYPGPDPGPLPYKNLHGCNLYNEKKKACDPLHPDTPFDQKNAGLRRTQHTQRQLKNLINDYETCIASINKMDKCIVKGVDGAGDEGHRGEKNHRLEDLADYKKQLYEKKKKKKKEKKEKENGRELVERAEEENAKKEETKERNMRIRAQLEELEELEPANFNTDFSSDGASHEELQTNLQNAFNNIAALQDGAEQVDVTNEVFDIFCEAWKKLIVYPTSKNRNIREDRKAYLQNMLNEIKDLRVDIKRIVYAKCRRMGEMRRDKELADVKGGQRKKTKKAKMKRKYKKTKNKKGKTKKKMRRKTLKKHLKK